MAMPDQAQASKASAVGVDEGIDPTATTRLLAHIQADNPRLSQLMQMEHKPDDPRRDRSAHFAHVVKCLFAMDFTDREVVAVAVGAPFAKKFAGRVPQRFRKSTRYGRKLNSSAPRMRRIGRRSPMTRLL